MSQLYPLAVCCRSFEAFALLEAEQRSLVRCWHLNSDVMLASMLGSSSVAFTPPGLLAGLVEQKRREVEKLYRLPDSREDGPWGLRLRYPASEGTYKLGRAIGWRRDSLAVLADLKRASPGSALGVTEPVDPQMDVMDAVQKVCGVCGAGCGAALWRRMVRVVLAAWRAWPCASPSRSPGRNVPACINCR